MIRHRALLLAAVPLAAALALAGCGADRRSGESVAPQSRAEQDQAKPAADQPGADPAGAGQPGAGQPGAGQPGNAAAQQYRREGRSIVYTGELTVRVEDAERAAARAAGLTEAAGGFVAGDKRSSTGGRAEVHLTLRVPADRFVSAVDGLAALGDEESRTISTEDVTQQVVDLDAQIASQKASVERTRALLARAQSIGEIVSIEAELAKRESALATLEARRERLADLSALSTVTVHLLTPGTPGVAEEEPGFLAGLGLGWTAFVGAVTVLLTVLGFLLPFLAVLALPGGLVWWLVRRRRAAVRTAAPPPSG